MTDFDPDVVTEQDLETEAQYDADMDRSFYVGRINELLNELAAERVMSQRFEAQLDTATAAEVDAVQRAQELQAELRNWRNEYNELKRLLTAALKENPGWYTQAAVDAERLLGIREAADE